MKGGFLPPLEIRNRFGLCFDYRPDRFLEEPGILYPRQAPLLDQLGRGVGCPDQVRQEALACRSADGSLFYKFDQFHKAPRREVRRGEFPLFLPECPRQVIDHPFGHGGRFPEPCGFLEKVRPLPVRGEESCVRFPQAKLFAVPFPPVFGLPSLWVWQIVWWLVGVGMMYVLAFRLEMSMPPRAPLGDEDATVLLSRAGDE